MQTPPDARPICARRGFTLIEILMVVVILGIVAAIIVPQLGSRDDLKTTAAARSVVADLIYAQNLAISKQRMYYVRFDPVAETYEVLSAISPTAEHVTHPVELAPFVVKLGATGTFGLRDVTIDTAAFEAEPVLAFDEMGVPYAWSPVTGTTFLTNGSIRLKAGAHVTTVVVEPFTGELKLQ